MTQHEVFEYTPGQEAEFDRLDKLGQLNPEEIRRKLGVIASKDEVHDPSLPDAHSMRFSPRAMTAPDAAEHAALRSIDPETAYGNGKPYIR